MRHGSTNRRQQQRGRNNVGNGQQNHHNRRPGAPNRTQVFDSNGPDVRIRGTAFQIVEKYAALAKDAASSGDRTLAENYLQHAEHYQRIISSWGDLPREQAPQQQQSQANQAETEAEEEIEDLGLPASLLVKAPIESGNLETV